MEIMVDQGVYEGILWAVIVAISCVFVFYAYLLYRLSKLTRSYEWRVGFRSAAACSLLFGCLRIVVAIWYYEDPAVRLSIPITAAISWVFIAIVGYATVRWIEQAAARIHVARDGMTLMNDVIEQAIDPLLKGEETSPATVERLRARQRDLVAAAR